MSEESKIRVAMEDTDKLYPALLSFLLVAAIVAGAALQFTPRLDYAGGLGILSSVIASRVMLGEFDYRVLGVALVCAALLFVLERHPSSKTCDAMRSTASHLEDQQQNATEYWQYCSNPSSDDLESCADARPDQSLESLKNERDYLVGKISRSCNID